MTKQLFEKIIQQERQYNRDNKIKEIKNKITRTRLTCYHHILVDIRAHMNESQQRLNNVNQEPGASSLILLLPLEDEGYVLNKQLFWDLIHISYCWELIRLPESCVCGVKFGLQHALSCKKGRFVTIRHNEVKNITATLLMKFATMFRSNHSLSGEHFDAKTANKHEDARLDISARGFWCSGQKALFDVRVFNTIASRYRNTLLSKCYTINKNEKKKRYNERVLQVEHGNFTPLVMSSNGGFGREYRQFYLKLAERIAEKRKQQYSIISSWIKRKVIFSLLRSIGLCLRVSRSIKENENIAKSIENDAVVSERLTKIAFKKCLRPKAC